MEGQVTKLVEAATERRDKLLEMTQSQVGKERVGLGSDKKLTMEVVPIGILTVDDVLGGGLRRGRMAMVIGQESMGKTLFTQWVIKAFQEQGGVCGFIDPEKTYESQWFTRTGVNVDDLIVVQPESTEQAFDLASMWSQEGMDLIVIDSLAALTPKARVSADLNDQEFMGLQPRKVSEGLNRYTNANHKALLVCTNQMRSKLGVVYGSPDDIPGGRAMKHYASYVIKISRKGWIKDGDTRVGYHMGVETLKNKLAPPFQSTSIPFMYTGVVDTVVGALDLALDLDLISNSRGYYTWREQKVHGRNKLVELFRASTEDLDVLQEMIKLGAG